MSNVFTTDLPKREYIHRRWKWYKKRVKAWIKQKKPSTYF